VSDLPASITAAEYHATQAAKMTEKALQDAIIGAAERQGWLVYHTYDSRRSESGYPDLHLVHAELGISLLRELKSERGTVSPAQRKWLTALQLAGVDVAVWRPTHWFDGTIDTQLAGMR
jgi:hypothetical protein